MTVARCGLSCRQTAVVFSADWLRLRYGSPLYRCSQPENAAKRRPCEQRFGDRFPGFEGISDSLDQALAHARCYSSRSRPADSQTAEDTRRETPTYGERP